MSPLEEFAAYDDIGSLFGSGPVAPRAEQAQSGPAVDRRLVAVSRRVLYLQALLLGAISLAALAAGYTMGRSGRAEKTRAPAEPVAVQGQVVYQAAGAQPLPDAQAVVIAFPKGVIPSDKIPTAGLRPDDPPPGSATGPLEAVEASEGVYRRADERGQFEFRVRPGVYQVLVISKHQQRPPGTPVSPEDLLVLDDYFAPSAELIGPYRYEYSERRLPAEGPFVYTFGP
jgi:hypothetical protein